MSGKTAWTALLAGVAAVLFGGVVSFAQRDFRGQPSASEVGRFRAVNVSRGEIILLDTATGNLFTAGPKDIKPISALRREANRDTVEAPGFEGGRKELRIDDKRDDGKFDDKKKA